MQEERYTGNAVIARGYAIYDEWKNKKYSSRRIVNSVQTAVASASAKKAPRLIVEALALLFALDLRIKERYDNLLKCLIFYFAWRRESDALKRFKGILSLPEGKDMREIIEIELERLRMILDTDKDDPTDKKARGGRVSEFPGYELGDTARDQISETALNENANGGIDKEKDEEEAEEAEIVEGSEETKNKVIRENAEINLEIVETKKKKIDNAPIGEMVEIAQDLVYEYKTENNGFDEKPKPSQDKNLNSNGFEGAINTPPYFEETVKTATDEAPDFIDEVIMDNMIKGETDIIAHNPLEDTKRDVAFNQSNIANTAQTDKNGEESKDAHLYDKMVLESKGGGVVTPQREETRFQIRVEESISEENQFRRDINLQFNRQMILVHKAFMENALREEFKIAVEESDENNSNNLIVRSRSSKINQNNMKSSQKH